MTSGPDSSTHAIPRFAHAVDAALDKVQTSSAAFMSASDKADALITLAKVESRLAALRMRVLAASDEVGENGAFRGVTDFLAHELRADGGPIAADRALAVELDRRWVHVAEAFAAGSLSVAKVRIIVAALEQLALDPDVPAEVLESAEQHLVSDAVEFSPKQLRRLARRILDVVAPHISEDREAKCLAAEEARALRRLSLTFREAPDGLEGVTEIVARVPSASGARLRTYLEAFTAPRHLPATAAAEDALGTYVPYKERLGYAFCSLLERLDPARMPAHGGTATSVFVTISYDDLKRDLGIGVMGGSLAGETTVTAGHVRRLACTANLIPVVLGTNSEILDLGRTARLFSQAQHKAMALRDKGCRAEGCTIPAAWCEAHHFRQPWSRGGRTDLADGKLMCCFHHHRAHDDRYLHIELPNGDVRFSRRR